MSFDKKPPKWMNPGVEPPAEVIQDGWKANQKPPADWHNWYMHELSDAVEELQEKAAENTDMDDINQKLLSKSDTSHNHDAVYQKLSEKGMANGYASLNASGVVPSNQLPPAADMSGKEDKSMKGVNGGYAPLNSLGNVPRDKMPSTQTVSFIGDGNTSQFEVPNTSKATSYQDLQMEVFVGGIRQISGVNYIYLAGYGTTNGSVGFQEKIPDGVKIYVTYISDSEV